MLLYTPVFKILHKAIVLHDYLVRQVSSEINFVTVLGVKETTTDILLCYQATQIGKPYFYFPLQLFYQVQYNMNIY